MAEWHVTPDYVTANWTDELLHLMLEKLMERKGRESGAIEEVKGRYKPKVDDQEVSDKMLFAMMGDNVKVVKKDGN